MQFTTTVSAVLALSAGVLAYDDNCKGSSIGLTGADLDSCKTGANNLDVNAQYSDQFEFSVNHCYLIYATNGAGAQPVSGQVLKDTVLKIVDECSKPEHDYIGEGSYGTGNCDSCHVTVNFRGDTAPPSN